MIKFKLELNKEWNSLTKIIKDKNEFALTENELESLIEQVYNLRPDVFGNIERSKDIELNTLKNELKDSQDTIDYLQDKVNDLEYELEGKDEK